MFQQPFKNEIAQQGVRTDCPRPPAFAPDGFTLIEMVIVLAILTVLTAVCLPLFQSATKSYRMSSAVLAVTGAIQSTRYQAIMHGYPYTLTLDPTTQTYQVKNELPGAATFTNVSTAIPWSADQGIALSPATTLQFSPGGIVTVNSGAMVLILNDGTVTETITVSEVGNVTVSP